MSTTAYSRIVGALVGLVGVTLVAACGGGGSSGAVVAGTVQLSDSPDDASGVLVRVGRVATRTPADGKFVLAGIEKGKKTLTAEKQGYQPVSKTVDLSGGGRTDVGKLKLQAENRAPTIEAVSAGKTELKPGGTVSIEVQASDPNGDELTYLFSTTGGFTVEESSKGSNTATVKAPDEFGARGEVQVRVEDGNGGIARESLDVRTVGNRAPSIRDLRATDRELPPGGTATLTVVASDPDGDALTYEWSAPDKWSVARSGALRTEVTAPEDFGESASIAIKVEDEFGATASSSIELTTGQNEAPQIRAVTASPPQVAPGGQLGLKVEAADPEGQDLSYQWAAPSGWMIADAGSKTTGVTAPGAYGKSAKVTVQVSDASGAKSSGEVWVSTRSNNGPRISGLSTSPSTVAAGGTIVAVVGASDPNGDNLAYTWDISGKGWSITAAPNDPSRANVSAPKKPGRTGIVQVKVSDGAGGTARASATVSTEPNRAPVVGSLGATPSTVARGGTSTVAVGASDPDGDKLSYTWSTPKDWSINSGKGTPTIEVQAPDKYGDTGIVSVEVADSFGATTTRQLVLSTESNAAPVVESLTVGSNPVARDGRTTAVVDASDPNRDSLSYTWSISGKGWSVKKNKNQPARATVMAPKTPSDTATLNVEVSDGFGGVRSESKVIRTKANKPPKVTEPASNLQLGDKGNPSPLSHSRNWAYQVQATDPDGDSLSYSLKTQTGATIDKNGRITWRPSKQKQGKHTLEITVSDGFDSVTRKMVVEVGAFGFDITDPERMTQKRDGMDFGDLNGDGRADAVYVDYRSNQSADIEVAFGQTDGFSVDQTYSWTSRAERCASPEIGDVDGDNDRDVIVLCDRGRSQDSDDLSWYVWRNDGNGKFSKGTKGSWNVNDGHTAADIELGDVDGDNDLDVVAAGDETLVIGRNRGNGRFPESDEWHDSYFQWAQIELPDVDGDGKAELATTYYDSSPDRPYVEVRDVDSNGRVGSRLYRDSVASRYDNHPDVLGVGDWDGDGRPGLMTMNREQDRLEIHRNQGGNFQQTDTHSVRDVPTARSHNAASAGDFDGDGHLDLVFCERRNEHFTIGFGKGDGTFRSWDEFSIGSNYNNDEPWGVHAADWNGDGAVDVGFGTQDGRLGIAH
ncbi:MAG: Ig-like domain-containing protein [Bradymonadaceae bacterium]